MNRATRKTYTISMCIALFMLLLTGCQSDPDDRELLAKLELPLSGVMNDSSSEIWKRQLLQQFVEDKLTNETGINTNYIDTNQDEAVATGHEVLSESLGLAMRYYARTDQQQAFEVSWQQLQSNFDISTGFAYRYSPKQQRTYTVNAGVDDLRIVRALLEGAQQFEKSSYVQDAIKLSERYLQFNIKHNDMVDFYDAHYNMSNDFITLCYIDVRTLELITIVAEESGMHQLSELSDHVADAMIQIAKNGYISNDFPFYETRYSYSKQQYESQHIHTVESMLTILSLVEIGQHEPSSIQYIKKHVEQGTLYGKYSREGEPLTDVQSTAIYAIAAMIASELGDRQLFEESMSRMEQFQVLDGTSEIYGAYGNTDTLEVYSFDQLQALLAYSY